MLTAAPEAYEGVWQSETGSENERDADSSSGESESEILGLNVLTAVPHWPSDTDIL